MSISIILPIFFIVAGGWFFKKWKIVDESWIHILNSFAYFVSLPAVILSSIWDIDFFDQNTLRLLLFSIITFAAFSALVFILLHFLSIGKNSKAAIFLAATTGNTIYMGFPIIESLYGKAAIPKAAMVGSVYLIPPLLMAIFIVRYWYSKEHSIAKEMFRFLKNPLVISAILGVIMSFIKIDSEVLMSAKKSLAMLGATASPLALFILGAFLYGKFFKRDLHLMILSVGLKMIVFPLLVFGVFYYFFEVRNFQIPVFLSAMPVAVTTFVIAEKFRLDQTLIGNTILASTVVSFFAVPIINYLIR